MAIPLPDVLKLGPFELRVSQRELWAHGQLVPLEPAYVDMLVALASRPGEILRSNALPASANAWAGVTAINSALASVEPEGFYVAHFPGEGFLFVMSPVEPERALSPSPNLPSRAAPIFGRDDLIAQLDAQLAQRRLITIVGAGGMGKSTVALAVAQRVAARFADGVYLLELASLSDARHVQGALAAALGIEADLLTTLRDKHALIVLDSCEHLIDAIAALAETLLAGAPGLHIVATSREPLLAADECLHRLAPVGLPARDEVLSAAQAMAYPALQLFVERAQAVDGSFHLNDENAPIAASVCRRLDGIPLAIELAAARVGVLGLAELSSQLSAHMLTLSSARPGGEPRHRTLAAMLDWSYALLAAPEKAALNRLSVFRGAFTLAGATAVAADDPRSAGSVIESVLDLVAKSLMSVSAATGKLGESGFRLLDTTRAYALEKLERSDDGTQARRQHANYVRGLLEECELAWIALTHAEWRAHYAPWAGDVRAALAWAFSPTGDDDLGIRLTIASFALAEHTGAMSDHIQYAEHALGLLGKMPVRRPDLEMRLKAFPTIGYRQLMEHADETEGLLRTLDTARASGNSVHVMTRLMSMWSAGFFVGNYPEALKWVDEMQHIAIDHSDPIAGHIANRTSAQSLHFMGDHVGARRLAEHVLQGAWRKIPLSYVPSPVGVAVSMRLMLARMLWMQGFAEQAARMAREGIEHATEDSPIALCQALAVAAVPIALWSGDRVAARAMTDQLGRQAKAHAFGHWEAWWDLYENVLLSWENGKDFPLHAAQWQGEYATKLRDQMGTFDSRFFMTESWERVEAGTVGWCAPEVMRIQAEKLLKEDVAQARALMQRAQEVARQQEALAWELRIAMSMVRMATQHGGLPEAMENLTQTFGHFTEGFDTADLRSAAALLSA